MEKLIDVSDTQSLGAVFGEYDGNMKAVEEEFGVKVITRDSAVKISGDDEESVEKARQVVEGLLRRAKKGDAITEQNVSYFISLVAEGNGDKLDEIDSDCICITAKGKPIKPKTLGQKEYIKSIRENSVTVGVGPAGTGKTYLAVAMAVTSLRNKQVSRIVITRPAVEAGEKLGFLPGDLQNKVDPYLRPLNDALFDMLGTETYQRYVEKNVIEVAPLAYMRGRTLDDSFIILDEAQNTTVEQMKMFLTRMGFRSKIVVTGDITQIDLPADKKSGLKDAISILQGIDDIKICNLTHKDVVRHQLVQKIIQAYEKAEAKKEAKLADEKKRYYRNNK